jgi:hypothetical protein
MASACSVAQENIKTGLGNKGNLTFYWGYNRSYYASSNLHIHGPKYDFTLYNLKAKDRPSPFGTIYFRPATISVPQYCYRIGYHITDNLVISAGLDHMKYVLVPDQWTTISGVIEGEASPKYAGHYLNQPIQLASDLLQFEHSDGYNLTTLDLEYQVTIKEFRKQKLRVRWNSGFGGVWLITRTDVRVFNDGLNNDFHLSGYAFSGKMGPRLEFRNRYFLLAELRGVYSTLPDILLKNEAPQRADQNISAVEYYIAVGYIFDRKKEKAQ